MTTRRKICVAGVAVGIVVAASLVFGARGGDKPRVEAKFLRHTASNQVVILITNLSRTAVKCIAWPAYSPSPGVTNFSVGYGSILEAHDGKEFPLLLSAGTNNGFLAIRIYYHRWPGRLYLGIESLLRRFGVRTVEEEFVERAEAIEVFIDPPPPKTPSS